MPIGFLSDAERERLDSFPAQVVPGDIETYFTLSRATAGRSPGRPRPPTAWGSPSSSARSASWASAPTT